MDKSIRLTDFANLLDGVLSLKIVLVVIGLGVVVFSNNLNASEPELSKVTLRRVVVDGVWSRNNARFSIVIGSNVSERVINGQLAGASKIIKDLNLGFNSEHHLGVYLTDTYCNTQIGGTRAFLWEKGQPGLIGNSKYNSINLDNAPTSRVRSVTANYIREDGAESDINVNCNRD